MLQLEWGLKWVAELQVVPDYILQRGGGGGGGHGIPKTSRSRV